MNKLFRFIFLLAIVLFGTKARCKEATQWLGNFSLAMSHGLNYHFDGNRTMYWDKHSSRYRINNGTSYEVSYRFSKGLSISCFGERFSGIYKDSISLYRDDIISNRFVKNIALALVYKKNISERFSIVSRLGMMKRTGYEGYAFQVGIGGQIRTVELSDFGLTAGLGLEYLVRKGISVFALADYTRFVHLYSSESGERDFYDGPTQNYIRTRIGIQYSFSHLLSKRE